MAAPRTASITGGYVALAAALITFGMERLLVGKVAAVSVGMVGGANLLDLDYAEDHVAQVDFNVVGTDAGRYVELQGTAEGRAFSREDLDGLLDLAKIGLGQLFEAQAAAIATVQAVTSAPRILVATRSRHKLGELRDLLRPRRATLVALDDLGIAEEAEETGATFAANAALKARFYARLSGLSTLADDSGLEVDALGGSPGVRTRRYAGEDATDEQNNAKLLAALAALPPEERGARYRCVLALALPGRAGPRGGLPVVLARGTFSGRIAVAPRGANGFGYDPIFEPASEPPGGRDRRRVAARAQAGGVTPRPGGAPHGPDPRAFRVLTAPPGRPAWSRGASRAARRRMPTRRVDEEHHERVAALELPPGHVERPVPAPM